MSQVFPDRPVPSSAPTSPQWGPPPDVQAPQQPPPYAPAPHPYLEIPARPRTNGFAIASLILGVLGGIVLSVIFGIIALRQIPRRGQGGKGAAIGGLIASGLWTALLGTVAVVSLQMTDASRDATGAIIEAGRVPTEEIRLGDCLEEIPELDRPTFNVEATPCSEPHMGQVYEDVSVEVFFFHPSRSTWRTGDRTSLCVAEYMDGARRGSLLD